MFLKKISEQVKRRLLGGNPSSDVKIDDREIQLHIVQAINELLKLETFQLHDAFGQSSIPHFLLGTYTVDVNSYGSASNVVTSQTTNFSADGYSSQWVDSSGNAWVDSSGNTWLTGGSEVEINWSIDSGTTYTIEITNIDYNTGEDAAGMNTFYSNITSNGTFNISSTDNTIPKVFYQGGISSFSATGTSITFSYDVSQSSSLTEIQTAVAATSTIITTQSPITAGPGSGQPAEITNFSKTEYTQSSVSLGSATLPVQPVSLPDNMGIWSVHIDPLDPFIPLPVHGVGIYNRISHTNISAAFNNVNTYRIENNKTLVFNQLTTSLPSQITVQMAVVDPDILGELDLLPIPADMEGQVIAKVLQLMGVNMATDNVNNENPVV